MTTLVTIELENFFDSWCEPSEYLFHLSKEKDVFPDDLKLARVTRIMMLGFIRVRTVVT